MIVYLDLSKAIDTIEHTILKQNVNKFSIKGPYYT
jgi:hypothetical protein